MKSMLSLGALTALPLLLGGCIVPVSVTPNLCREVSAQDSLQIRLMFGMTRPDGTTITEGEWQDFLAREVTPRFPAGFSVISSYGQWYDAANRRVTKEPSRLLWIVTVPNRDLLGNLHSIRQDYMQRFSQQSVGLAIQNGCASF
ncbi:DUF3574 domain-containing protein [Gluconobacter morbifer]|uniref:Lipoprotein n=1 Tax=Gluconobacter morbifer G707 TaxID=1088869 RepID=G6XIG3_9PROT|nr:DUF3574 domain-containing protein [Gluconobacter morbifer]EHH68603.1 hypothetical protein GMO_13730 [Gluconobacter morbifer G707]